MTHIEEFRAAMRSAGIAYEGEIRDDGKLHRIKHSGRSDDSGFYVLHPPNPLSGGHFGCWAVLPDGQNWSQKNGNQYSSQEMAAFKRQWADAARQKEKADADRHERYSVQAKDYFKGLKPPEFSNGYLQSKRVIAYGAIAENHQGDLALPLTDIDGKIWSYQTIDCLGDKLFMPGGRVAGCFYVISDRTDGPVVICEGYATGATIHEATGYATVCAMNCGNLLPVAKALRERWKDRTILIAADNDRFTKKGDEPFNPGIDKAKAAATAIRGILVVPEFPEGSRGSDFNDLENEAGREVVVTTFERAYPCPLSVMTFDQISRIPTTEADRLYGEHLLDRGSNLVILGQGGTGKTRFVYQMIAAPHMAKDKFLTLQIHPGAKNFKWLVLQAENGVERLKHERETLRKMLGTAYSRFNEFVRVLVPMSENDTFLTLDNPETLRRIQQTIEHANPDGVIWDSLYDFGTDLNKDAEMKATLTTMTRLTRHRNPKRPLVVLHHAATGVQGAMRSIGYERSGFARNSKVIANWARAIINIVPASEEDNSRLIISCGKCSNGKEFHPFAVQLDEATMTYVVDGEMDVAEWVREKTGKTVAITAEEIAEMAGSSGINRTGLSKLIRDQIACTRESSYRYIRQAISKGRIRQSGEMLFKNSK